MYEFFVEAAQYCNEYYGAELYYDENDLIEGFECPNCGEPIYFEDWRHSSDTDNWLKCPVCEEFFAYEP